MICQHFGVRAGDNSVRRSDFRGRRVLLQTTPLMGRKILPSLSL